MICSSTFICLHLIKISKQLEDGIKQLLDAAARFEDLHGKVPDQVVKALVVSPQPGN